MNTSVQCVIDEDHVTYVKDLAVLLSAVQIQDPLSQIISQICLCHHSRFGCGIQTLLSMVHLLKQAGVKLVNQGVPLYCIIQLMREAVDFCIEEVDEIAIPVVLTKSLVPDTGDQILVNNNVYDKENGTWSKLCEFGAETLCEPVENFKEIHFQVKENEIGDVRFTGNGTVACEPVFLEMKSLGEEVSSEIDDISWFLDLPLSVDMNNSLDTSMPENPGEKCDQPIHNEHVLTDDCCEVTGLDTVETLIEKKPSGRKISSRNDCYDSDFEDCFNSIESVVPSRNGKNIPQNNSIKKQMNCKLKNSETENIEDEFDACFDSPTETDDNLSRADKYKVSEPINFESTQSLQFHNKISVKDNILNTSQYINSTCHSLINNTVSTKNADSLPNSLNVSNSSSGSPDLKQLDKLLNLLPNSPKKCVTASGSTILNSSRHFKTFHSAVPEILSNFADLDDEMPSSSQFQFDQVDIISQNVPFKSQNEPKYQENLNQQILKLDQMLKSISGRSSVNDSLSNKILNSSRHFRKINGSDKIVCTEAAVEYSNAVKIPLNSLINNNKIELTEIHNSASMQNICNKNKISLQPSSSKSDFSENKIPNVDDINVNSVIERALDRSTKKTISNVFELGDGLARGSSMMQYAVQCCEQSRLENYQSFDTRRIQTCLMIGPNPDHTRLVNGIVLTCTIDTLVFLKKHHPVKALLLNGDLTSSFHHKGYKECVKGTVVLKTVPMETREDFWISQMISTLKKLGVNTILLKGHTNSTITDALLTQNIVVMEMVPYKVLEALSLVTSTIPLIYIQEAFEDNICKNIKICEFDDGYLNERYKTMIRCILTCDQHSCLQTLVICHPCQLGAEVREQEFWKCANRLSNALNDGKVLPGGAKTEDFCYQAIQSRVISAYENLNSRQNELKHLKPVVFEEIGNIFREICGKIKENVKQESESYKIINMLPYQNDLIKYCNKTHGIKSYPIIENIIISTSSEHPFRTCVSNESTEEYFQGCVSGGDTTQDEESFQGCVSGGDTTQDECPDIVFDNYRCKVVIWRKALEIVIDILRTDAMITTGINEDNNIASSIVQNIFENKIVL